MPERHLAIDRFPLEPTTYSATPGAAERTLDQEEGLDRGP